jgi:hypothetical protein
MKPQSKLMVMIISSTLALSACTFKNGNFVLFDHTKTNHVPVTHSQVPAAPLSQPATAGVKAPVASQGTATTAVKPEPITQQQIIQATKAETSKNPGPEFAAQIASQLSLIQQVTPQVCKPMLPASQLPLTWYFKAVDTLNLDMSGVPVNLTVETNTQNVITLKVLNDDKARLVSGVKGNTLIIKMENNVNPTQVVLSLPVHTQTLTLALKGNIMGPNFPNTVHNLSILGANSVDLTSQNIMLNRLYIDRTKSVTMNGIATPYLLTWIHESGPVNLYGFMNLREIDMIKTGPVHMYWLNSPILTIRAKDHSQLFLAGVANTYNFVLDDHSHLDARYLRVKKGFVKTNQQAKAEITVEDSLNAMASGQSNIYYYHQPKLIGRYYRDQGSILYMGENPPPCDLPYCPTLPNPLPG